MKTAFIHKTLIETIKYYNIFNVKKQGIFITELHINLKSEKSRKSACFTLNVPL